MTKITPFIAALVIFVQSSTGSVVLALSIPLVHSGANCHCSAFAPFRQTQTHHHRSRISHGVRISSLPLKAAAEQSGGFFGDDSAGDFFKETEKPPSNDKQEEAPEEEAPGDFFKKTEKPPSKDKEEEAPMTIEELEMLATPFDEHLPKINTVNLVGRVGNDPEPRYFDDGKVVLNLSLAVKRKYHPLERKVREIRSGEEETDWFALELWGRDAEYVANYVEKGTRLGITGSLAMDGWIDKRTGEQRRKPKIVVRHTDILESKAEAELRKSNKAGYNANGNSGGSRRPNEDDDDDGGPAPAGTGGFFN